MVFLRTKQMEKVHATSAYGKMVVWQNGFGYTFERDRSKKGQAHHLRKDMVTGTASTCHAIYLADKTNRLRVIAHLDQSIDEFLAIVEMISHLVAQGLLRPGQTIETSEIHRSALSWRPGVKRSADTLKFLGMPPTIYSRSIFAGWLGCTEKGQQVTMKFGSLNGIKDANERRAIYLTASNTSSIYCSNTGRFVGSENLMGIYPGVPILTDQPDVYGIRIPVTTSFEREILTRIHTPPLVFVDIRDCPYGEYIYIHEQLSGRSSVMASMIKNAIQRTAFEIDAKLREAGFRG